MSIISEKYSFKVVTTLSGSIFSDIEVKPLMSVNKIVTSLCSPPRLSFPSSPKSSSTTCFDTYLLNVFFTLLTSEMSSIAKTDPCLFPAGSSLGDMDTLIIVSSETVLRGMLSSDFVSLSISDVVIISTRSSSFSNRYI